MSAQVSQSHTNPPSTFSSNALEPESPEYEAEVKRVRDELLGKVSQEEFERELSEAYRLNAALSEQVYREWECTMADGLDGLDD